MLRGAGADELRAVKRVVWLAVSVAYNLRLEVSYLNDRRACLVPSLLPSFYTPISAAPSPSVGPAIATSAASGTAVPSSLASLAGADGSAGGDGGEGGGGGGGGDGGGDKSTAATAAAAALVDGAPLSSASATAHGQSSGAASAAAATGGTAAGAGAAAAVMFSTGAAGDDKGAVEAAVALEGGGTSVVAEATGAGSGVSEVASAAAAAAAASAATATDGAVRTPAGEILPPEGKVTNGVDGDDRSVLDEPPMLSSSLGVDFGDIPSSFELRRKNVATVGARVSPTAAGAGGMGGGGAAGDGLGGSFVVGGEHFAFKNQNLTIASVWMAQGTQCCSAGLKSMQYYAEKVTVVLRVFESIERYAERATLAQTDTGVSAR